MREKTRYRISMFWDVCIMLFVGFICILLNHMEFASILLDVLIAVTFTSLGLGQVFSPRFRRYMRKQQTGIQGVPEAELVGKYTILEDEFERIREACAKTMCQHNPSLSLRKWQGRRWEAIKDPGTFDFAWALIPGMFRNTDIEEKINRQTRGSGEVWIETCVVAFWNGREWEPVPFYLPGDEFEATPMMNSILDDDHSPR